MALHNLPTSLYLERYLTQRAKNALLVSIEVSYRDYNEEPCITESHLLYALIEEKGSMARNILHSHNIRKSNLLYSKKREEQSAHAKKVMPKFSHNYKMAVKKAAQYAMKHEHHFIGTEHLLYGLLNQIKQLKGISSNKSEEILKHLDEIMFSSVTLDTQLKHQSSDDSDSPSGENFEGITESPNYFSRESGGPLISASSAGEEKSILGTYCDNISHQADTGTLEPVIGRDAELNRILNILARKEKNNPILVGEAGVGKTALVRGVAKCIHDGKAPRSLIGKNVYTLNLSNLLAGTVYRGEFEERVRDLADEASEKEAIIFIDEIHTLVGAGAAQGSIDAANILKPALANGVFQCIGATTDKEYKETIEKDAALARRFQKVTIKEQTAKEALDTLKHLKPFYEKHHKVKIPDSALEACVNLAQKYVPQRALPDSALDILDEAASNTQHQKTSNRTTKLFKKLEKEYENLSTMKRLALEDEKYKRALLIKNREGVVREKLNTISKEIQKEEDAPKLGENFVYKAASDITSIPLTKLTEKESSVLQNLENKLEKRVLGQPEAVQSVAKAVQRSRTGTRSNSRPARSLLFMGPSGVGKTELAKVLAGTLNEFNPANSKNEEHSYETDSLIKLDMSEFSEPHTVARLLGAPPGYVGYEEAGLLTDAIQKNPYSVVLFDEIEKAHPKIFQVLLQILEEGSLTDTQGRKANFKNAFIVLTSNLGAEKFNSTPLGFSGAREKEEMQKIAHTQLKHTIKPEILNRIDETIVFRPLEEGSLRKIASMQLKELKQRFSDTVKITYSPSLPGWVAKNASGLDKGARGIRNVVEEKVEEEVARKLLEDSLNHLHIDVTDDTITANKRA